MGFRDILKENLQKEINTYTIFDNLFALKEARDIINQILTRENFPLEKYEANIQKRLSAELHSEISE